MRHKIEKLTPMYTYKKILITIPERTIEQLKDIAEEVGEYKGPCPNKSRAIRIAVNYYWKRMTKKGLESENNTN